MAILGITWVAYLKEPSQLKKKRTVLAKFRGSNSSKSNYIHKTPGEIKRREVMLDSHARVGLSMVGPGEIKRREVN